MSLAAQRLGWRATYSIAEGIAHSLQWAERREQVLAPQPGLDAGGFGNHGWVAVVGGDQAEVGEGLAAQHDPAFSTTRCVTFQVPSNGCTCA
jgi:hypothetical protein